MKRIAIILAAMSIMLVAEAAKPKSKHTVVYKTSIECKKCKVKIMDNIAFEKGVKDLSVDLPEKTIKIVFDEAKTDTLTLAKAIRKLGYKAKVIKYE